MIVRMARLMKFWKMENGQKLGDRNIDRDFLGALYLRLRRNNLKMSLSVHPFKFNYRILNTVSIENSHTFFGLTKMWLLWVVIVCHTNFYIFSHLETHHWNWLSSFDYKRNLSCKWCEKPSWKYMFIIYFRWLLVRLINSFSSMVSKLNL